ncbi:MAG: DUF4345 family protein [Pseudomonadales bacterium]
MWFSRLILAISGLAFGAYGVYCTANPHFAAKQIGYAMSNSSEVVEVMAMYGGLQLALGLIFLFCAVKQQWIIPGLACVAICTLCLASTRGIGISLHGADNYNLGALAYEASSAVLATVAWLLERKALSEGIRQTAQ